ncbi:hypothetical protein HYPP_03801 [Hyphomicrobium sp. ghe19]|nr:hypothetical protein HYPP_03801 [Hyphomicrobium sp. ghe19]
MELLVVGLALGLSLALIKFGFGWLQKFVPHQTFRRIWNYLGLALLAIIAVVAISPAGDFRAYVAVAGAGAFLIWIVLLLGLGTNREHQVPLKVMVSSGDGPIASGTSPTDRGSRPASSQS